MLSISHSMFHLVAILTILAACTIEKPDRASENATPDVHTTDLYEVLNDHYGIEGNPSVVAIGGGEGYGNWVDKDKAILVSTKDELLHELKKAQSGDVIYVDDNASIDLTGAWNIRIPGGVTLASGRGQNGSLGALLYTTANENEILFVVRTVGVHITGLRIKGPSTEERPGGCPKNPRGIYIRAQATEVVTPTLEIDNNEFWGWPKSAIQVVELPGVHIHHNFIHHNRRVVEPTPGASDPDCKRGYGLGYGINVSSAHVLIDANRFDYNRHDIASNGAPGSGYTARYNLILSHGTSHSFDVHGFGEQSGMGIDPPYGAGDLIVIHHNAFLGQQYPAIKIRGKPNIGAQIYQNQFAGPERTIVQKNIDASGNCVYYPDTVNFTVENNQFGDEIDLSDGC